MMQRMMSDFLNGIFIMKNQKQCPVNGLSSSISKSPILLSLF